MRFSRFISCLSLLPLITAISVQAQEGVVGLPGLGFAYDARSNQIRPIHGVPGAAILGDAVATTAGLSTAAISPQHDLALAVSTADHQLYAVRLPADGAFPIAGAAAALSQVVFSPAGSAAVLVGESLQVLTGLPSTFTLADLAMPSSAGDVGAVAIADDAQLLLLASNTEDSSSLWALVPGGAPYALQLSSPIAAAAFRPGTHDAVAATRSGDIYLIRNPGPSAEIRLVYSGDPQTAGPVAIRLSADGNLAYIANSGGILSSLDLLAGSVMTAACQCRPTGLYPMRSNGLFRITEISDAPVMLFDVSSPNPRTWFVPPDSVPAAGQRSAQ